MLCNIFRRKKARQETLDEQTLAVRTLRMAPQLSLNNTIKRKAVPASLLNPAVSLYKEDKTRQKHLNHPNGLLLNPVGSIAPVFSSELPALTLSDQPQLSEHTFESFFSHLTITTQANTTDNFSQSSSLGSNKIERQSEEAIQAWLDEVRKPEGLATSSIEKSEIALKVEYNALNEELRERKSELKEMLDAIEVAKEQHKSLSSQVNELRRGIELVKKENEQHMVDDLNLKDGDTNTKDNDEASYLIS